MGKATLTVTANNTNRIYGAANPAFTASYSGFVNGDTTSVLSGAPSLTTTCDSDESGGQLHHHGTNGTLSATNYTFSFVNSTLTIDQAPLAVLANNLTRAYGVTNPLFTISYAGFVNGDTTNVLSGNPGSLSTNAKTNSPVGAYVITNSAGTLSANNYAITYTNGTLTVTANGIDRDGEQYEPDLRRDEPGIYSRYSGFVNEETTNVLTGIAGGDVAAQPPTRRWAPYPITPTSGTLNAVNYSFAFVNGNLTINPVPLTVSANNTNRTYGATNPVFTVTYYGLLNGDGPSVFDGAPSLTTSANDQQPDWELMSSPTASAP